MYICMICLNRILVVLVNTKYLYNMLSSMFHGETAYYHLFTETVGEVPEKNSKNNSRETEAPAGDERGHEVT